MPTGRQTWPNPGSDSLWFVSYLSFLILLMYKVINISWIHITIWRVLLAFKGIQHELWNTHACEGMFCLLSFRSHSLDHKVINTSLIHIMVWRVPLAFTEVQHELWNTYADDPLFCLLSSLSHYPKPYKHSTIDLLQRDKEEYSRVS